MTRPLPKIYVFVNSGHGTDFQGGMAMAEDGHVLARHVSSCRAWFEHDMGLRGEWKHDAYREHYPDGYELVDISDAEVASHAGLREAYRRNQGLPALGVETAARVLSGAA